MTNTNAIEVSQLGRVFHAGRKGDVAAIEDISFVVPQGTIFGFLGPNGAGKTTTIKILTTLLLPTSGRAKVFGHDVVTEAKNIREQINFTLGGDRGFYSRLTGQQNLQFFCDLYRMPAGVAARRISELLETVALADAAHKPVEKYSRGMRQRLHIARALINSPRLVFLDEPTLGLDPMGIRDLRRIVLDLKQRGITVFLTTHYMLDVEALCDRIAVVRAGRLIANGTVEEVKRLVPQNSRIGVKLSRPLTETQLSELRGVAGVQTVLCGAQTKEDGRYAIVYRSKDSLAPLLERLNPFGIVTLEQQQPTLEDAFIELATGR